MRGFVCESCGAHVRELRNQFAERLEWRRLDARERFKTVTVRHICRTCVREAAAKAREKEITHPRRQQELAGMTPEGIQQGLDEAWEAIGGRSK